MNWLDIVILVIIVSGTFLGLKAGIIKAVFSLAGLIAGIILAGRYYAPLAEQLTFIPQANVAEIAAFAIILIAILVIAGVLARFLGWVASVVMLGWVNHLGGAAFGFVLGATFCSMLLATWVQFFDITDIILESSLSVILLDRLPAVLVLLPDEFDAMRRFFQ